MFGLLFVHTCLPCKRYICARLSGFCICLCLRNFLGHVGVKLSCVWDCTSAVAFSVCGARDDKQGGSSSSVSLRLILFVGPILRVVTLV